MEAAFLPVWLWWKAIADPARPLLSGGQMLCGPGGALDPVLDVPEVPSCCVLLFLQELCSWGLKNLAFYLLLIISARTVAGKETLGLLLTFFHLSCMLFQSRECAIAKSLAFSKLLHTHFFQQETDCHLFHGLCMQTSLCAYIQISPFSK